jgi:hypothetical protein
VSSFTASLLKSLLSTNICIEVISNFNQLKESDQNRELRCLLRKLNDALSNDVHMSLQDLSQNVICSSVPQFVGRMDVHHLPQLFPDTAHCCRGSEHLYSSSYNVITTSIMPDYKTGNEVCFLLYATFYYVFCALLCCKLQLEQREIELQSSVLQLTAPCS